MEEYSHCRSCGEKTQYLWNAVVLIDIDVKYFECNNCGYVQTEQPFWLDHAYDSPINESDTGLVARNIRNQQIVVAALWLMGKLDSIVIDSAGGYGLLVRLLRDAGINAFWSDKYCDNLLARGFEWKGSKAGLVTSFEAFEHFVKPSDELSDLLTKSSNVLISTLLLPSSTPTSDEWWYYGLSHGQHIGFFAHKSLIVLAGMHGKQLVSDGVQYHLFTDQTIQAWKWRLAIKSSRYLYKYFGRKLKSKVWSDYLLVESSTDLHDQES